VAEPIAFDARSAGLAHAPAPRGWLAAAWHRLAAPAAGNCPAVPAADDGGAAALGALAGVWARHLEDSARHGAEAVDRLTGVFAEIDRQLARAVGSALEAAASLGAGTEGAAGVLETARQQLDGVVVQLDAAMASRRALLASVAEVVGASQDLGAIADEVQKVAQMTALLSINARIEAARAGAAGRGFGVVADEVRRLAGTARDNAESIRERVARIDAAIGAASRDADRLRDEDAHHSDRARNAVAGVLGDFDAAAQRVAGASQSLSGSAELARASVAEALVQFQFQDRVGQRLGHVRANAEALAAALAAGWPAAPEVAALEAALEASYTMPEEGRTHRGEAGTAAANDGLVMF
jgi:methyl-accepting chemotaxis protein